MTRRVAPAQVLASPSRVEILHVLNERGPSTIDVLVEATGLHANTVREHLVRLAEGDYVRSEPEARTTRGRPRIVYRATSTAEVADDPDSRRVLEQQIAQAALTSALVRSLRGEDVSARAVAAGREVGALLPEPVREAPAGADPQERELLALQAHLDSFGFDPELDADTMTFHLWRCPFLEMARERPEVVCAVHSGLAQGVVDRAGGSYEIGSLTPFVGPEHCTLTLRQRPEGVGGPSVEPGTQGVRPPIPRELPDDAATVRPD